MPCDRVSVSVSEPWPSFFSLSGCSPLGNMNECMAINESGFFLNNGVGSCSN